MNLLTFSEIFFSLCHEWLIKAGNMYEKENIAERERERG